MRPKQTKRPSQNNNKTYTKGWFSVWLFKTRCNKKQTNKQKTRIIFLLSKSQAICCRQQGSTKLPRQNSVKHTPMLGLVSLAEQHAGFLWRKRAKFSTENCARGKWNIPSREEETTHEKEHTHHESHLQGRPEIRVVLQQGCHQLLKCWPHSHI